MAKNFSKAGSAAKLKEVEKKSAAKAQVVTLKSVHNNDLLDYPNNNEDITDTVDLEHSMVENGFTDPLEVTDYGMEAGKYMIVSGHRRRRAGVKQGYEYFPCVVREFENEQQLQNYVLLSNAHRDSAKDPLLYARRYKMHEQYLIDNNFPGNIRREVAKRLGISTNHADRYSSFNRIILPVWDMVRDEIVGMSSVLPMASHTPEEQEEILVILNDCLQSGISLTRDRVKHIVDQYRADKSGASAITETQDSSGEDGQAEDVAVLQDNGLLAETRSEPEEPIRTDEVVQMQPEEVAAEAEKISAEIIERESSKKEQAGVKQEKTQKNPDDMVKRLKKLQANFMDDHYLVDADSAKDVLTLMSKVFELGIDEMYAISSQHGLKSEFAEELKALVKKVKEYQE